jgi:RNA polymerase sigma-70 factor (ECF subfamily)
MSAASNELTPVSLLNKLHAPSKALFQDAWGKFVKLYTPLLFLWGRRVGAGEEDAADLVQDVFVILAREMPSFQHDPRRRFRGWLWTVLLHRWRDRVRQRAAQPPVHGDEDLQTVALADNVQEFAEVEYRDYLLNRAVELMQAEVPASEWRAWREYMVEGRPAAEVARNLGLTVNQVYLAKSRMLRRLRAELEGLLD